jgi:iron-sulfur cluster assembly protein
MISISTNASRQILKLLARQGMPQGGLRLAVKAGGCSGLSYVFGWDTAPRGDDDVLEEVPGARVFVDRRSLRFLEGTTLDYDTSLISKGFFINNPNAKATCGCGASFSV